MTQVNDGGAYLSSDEIKLKIVKLFNKNVRGKNVDGSKYNIRHDGRDGHWLEVQMGVAHNRNNSADIDGFEMKNDTTSKTTFGDWSGSYYIYKDPKFSITRDQFLIIFGSPNLKKKNRYSWSGKPAPKIGSYNSFGQVLKVDDQNNIYAIYSFSKDARPKKEQIVPLIMQKNNLVIASWDADMMKKRVENKFNMRGWFKCLKDSDGFYSNIAFGIPITFQTWINGVRKGLIFFDSGMYQGNLRPYSQWRADNKYWKSLITETY